MSVSFFKVEEYVKTLFPKENIWIKQFNDAEYLFIGIPEYEVYFLSVRLSDDILDSKSNFVTGIQLRPNKETFPGPKSYDIFRKYTSDLDKIRDLIFIYKSDIEFAIKKFKDFDFKADAAVLEDLTFKCLNKKTRVYELVTDDETTVMISFPYYISLSYMLWITNKKIEVEEEFASLDELLAYIVNGGN